jgi:hypothetical protein
MPSPDTLLLIAEIRVLRLEVERLTHHIVINLEPRLDLLTHRSFASAPPPVVDEEFHDASLAPLAALSAPSDQSRRARRAAAIERARVWGRLDFEQLNARNPHRNRRHI